MSWSLHPVPDRLGATGLGAHASRAMRGTTDDEEIRGAMDSNRPLRDLVIQRMLALGLVSEV